MMMDNHIDLIYATTDRTRSILSETDFLIFEDLQSKLNIRSKSLFKLYIKEVYKDLAERHENGKRKGISKITFFDYFKIPIFIGDSIFNAFDKDNDSFLNLIEIGDGLTSLYLGSFEEVARLIFNIYDGNLDGLIHKEDVRLTLSYIPSNSVSLEAYKLQLGTQEIIREIVDTTFSGLTELCFEDYLRVIETAKSESFVYLLCYLYDKKVFNHENIKCLEKKKELQPKVTNSSSPISSLLSSASLDLKELDSPQAKRKIPSPKASFHTSVDNFLGRKCQRRSSKLMERQTEANEFFDFFDFDVPATNSALLEAFEREKHAKIHNSLLSEHNDNINNNITAQVFDSPSSFKLSISTRKDTTDNTSQFSVDLTEMADKPFLLESEDQQILTTAEGWIYKLTETNKLKKYWLVVKDRDIFYYKNELKDELSGMHSLAGCSVGEALPKLIGEKKFYSFVIEFKSKTRSYYCEDRDDCFSWTNSIRSTIGFKSFFDYYEINEDIGRGKFGVVKLGTNKLTKEKVAIKTIKKENLKTKQDRELVKVEIEIMKLCTHHNVIRLLDHYENSEYIFIVMDYIKGGDLNKYVRNYCKGLKNNRFLPEAKVAELMKQLAHGLKYLHSYGIIHRDIKPENLMITENSLGTNLKIMDFGLSKMMHYGEKVADGFGTLSFVAPEVLQRKPYDFKVDIWSLGVTIFNLLSGDFPFDNAKDDENTIARKVTSSPLEFKSIIWNTISSEAKHVITRCLTKDQEKRITIDEFLESDWIKSREKEAFPNSKL